MADEIEMNLQGGNNEIETEVSGADGEVSVGLSEASGGVEESIESQTVNLTMGVESEEEPVSQKILTAENAAEEAVLAKNAALQAAEDAETYALQTRAAVNNMNNNLGEVEDAVLALRQRIDALEVGAATHVVNGEVDEGIGYFYNDQGDTLFQMTGMGGGGGGGGSGSGDAGSVVTLTNNTGWASTTVADGVDVILSFSWSSLEDGNPTGQGVMTVELGGLVRESRNIAQGNFTVNVKNYLNRGDNRVVVRVTDGYGKNKWKQFTVTVEQLKIESSFDDSEIQHGALTYSYTPYGAFTKTIHFELDGTETEPVITSSTGRQMSQIIRQQTHGAHKLRVWFTATINGVTVPSNTLVYDIMWVITGNNTPIISSSFSDNIVDQYSTLTIPFMVYTPDSMVSDVTIKLDGLTVNTFPDHGREMDSFQIRMDDTGNHVIRIQSGTAYKDIPVQVNAAEMNAVAETEDLKLYLSSAGRSNNEANPGTWSFTDAEMVTTAATFSGFNWVSNGWIRDNENMTALRVNNGASVIIPFQPFAGDFRQSGYTIELEFAARDVHDYNNVILQCYTANRGFIVTPQVAAISSEQSSLNVQFKDEDHIRISFVVEKRAENRLLMAYINGIPSRVVQYPANDDFSQASPVNIRIGGDRATIDVYNIRCYANDLTGEQILDNWIADTQNGELMLQRYSRNQVYDAYGAIDISKLPGNLPYMVIECEELPQYKGDKKTCTGRFVNPGDPTKSFTFTGCQINVQGTSSAVYARKNYDMQFKNGFDMPNGTNEKNYQMVSTVKPFNRFVMKADVASSEGANNVELVKLFCEISPFKTREMQADALVRQGIYGFPIVIFWTNTTNNRTTFLGKYNFNFPKRAPAPYGYHDEMESWEFQNNTSNLMLFKSDYFDETLKEDPTTGDIKATWLYDYEARFPDDTWTDYSKLQELQSFVYSTYRDEATGDAFAPVTIDGETYDHDTAAYRLAKFRDGIGNYAEINSLVFYYVFTEFFLLADSRAKNLFIGFSGSDTDPNKVTAIDRKAVCEPYDMDTALGINNEGSLTFTYSLEDTDHTGNGRDVFTGQSSVLWNNLRDAFPNEIRQMYQTLRSGSKMNYDYIEQKFEDHQAYWPEAIWIEDSRFKYTDPLTHPDPGKEPTGAYLEMMLGSKQSQRRWWLSNRFRYMDSKWSSGDALAEVIQFRAYARASLTITPYSDLYVTVKYGSYTGQEKTSQGVPVTIQVPIDNLSDTETYVYSASQIADVGDLSPFKLGWADFSHATRIQQIKIGDSDPLYENLPFERLTLGSNRLLKTLDCRNCVNLGTGEMKSVDMTGCTSIQEAYFDNTQITAVDLPNGSPIRKLHLPGTITNLTLRNQTSLTEFVCPDYSNITTLFLENPADCVDTQAIVEDLPALCRVRLYNFTWNLDDLDDVVEMFDKLDTMRGIDQNGNNTQQAQVYGHIHVTTAVGSQIAAIQARYPDVRITYGHVTSNVYYYTWDGQTLLATKAYTDGVGELYSGEPSRTSTPQYDFTFVGWARTQDASENDENAFANVGADRNVYAAYSRVVRTYTATFQRASIDGGGDLYVQHNVPYGTTPVYGGVTPVSANNDGGVYTFEGWNPALGPITGDTTYTAVFHDDSLIVTFMNGDTQVHSERVVSGNNATGPSTNPTKATTVSTVYTFAGWSSNPNATQADANALNNITADRTLYAVYTETARPYTITFMRAQEDGGGNALETKQVGYGSVPTYTGATPTSTKSDSVYQFSGWTPALAPVTGDATYTAVFEDVGIAIVFKNGETTLGTRKFARGSNGSWNGTTPSKDSTAAVSYTFSGWNENSNAGAADPNALTNIQYGKTLYAMFTETARTYTITFVRAAEDGGGNALETKQVAYGTVPAYTGATPTTTKEGEYTFSGWTPELAAVTGNQTYTAKFRDNSGMTRKLITKGITNAEHSQITNIRDYAFRYCVSLSTISFPAVTSIGEYAFNGCSSLTEALFPSVTTLGTSAFGGCSNLETISMPLLTSIPSNAFTYCSLALSAVSFPSVTYIGPRAFYECQQLTSISFPVATTIGEYAFAECSLRSAIFPSVTSIGNAAFSCCYNLNDVSFPAATIIGRSAFAGCSLLSSISFPVATSIGSFAFSGCSTLKTAEFPCAEIIDASAFYRCSDLTTVLLPVVSSIGSYAFTNCGSLTTVVLGYSSVVFLNNTNTFSNTANAIFYVPDSLITSYQNNTKWITFSSRIKGVSELPT